MDTDEIEYFEQLKKLQHADFAAQLNTKFRFFQDPHWIEGELIEVSDLKKYPRQESFNLLFRLPKNFAPIQFNYIFEHDRLGKAYLFLVPVENADDGYIFEAVFNRIFR